MKYIIERASDPDSMPCRDCVYEAVREIERFRGEKPAGWMASMCENVHKEGELWVGTSKEITHKWTKEVDSLTDFVEEHGRIVLEKSNYLEIPYEITIYDAYLE